MELKTAIQKRHSTHKFSSKKPDWRDIIESLDYSRFAPMAGDIYNLKWILIEDKEKIQKIAKAAQQNFIATAHYLVVACSEPKLTVNAYGERGEKYTRQQAGAAIQNFLLALEERGLATCWIGHFVDNQIQNILHIPGDIEIEAVFPIGYEYPNQSRRKRKIELDRITYYHKWKEEKMRRPPEPRRNA
ncbi:MAG: nitroreductase family protein [Nanoarchaeota archaeon]